jgi:hypothetical protein
MNVNFVLRGSRKYSVEMTFSGAIGRLRSG